jgi:hypothetical protein
MSVKYTTDPLSHWENHQGAPLTPRPYLNVWVSVRTSPYYSLPFDTWLILHLFFGFVLGPTTLSFFCSHPSSMSLYYMLVISQPFPWNARYLKGSMLSNS